MGDIMLEHQFGPREIIPASMWTGLTRQGLNMHSWQQVLRRSQEGFETSNRGIWLPLPEHSLEDYDAIHESLNGETSAVEPDGYVKYFLGRLGGLAISKQGCWFDDALEDTDTRLLRELSWVDNGNMVLETEPDLPKVRQCDSPNCVYPRHFDLTMGVPSQRRALLYPNTNYFIQKSEGVITAWGDTLPSVEASRQQLIEFQAKCLPNVDRSESLLTIGGISQICLLPKTGCWFVKNYYMTPIGVGGYENWQYDGYGRLKIPSSVSEQYRYLDYAALAHRVTWVLSGNTLANSKRIILNHKCGFRPCANPGHIEQISHDDNVAHGVLMSISTQMMDGKIPIKDGVDQLVRRARSLGVKTKNIKQFWETVGD